MNRVAINRMTNIGDNTKHIGELSLLEQNLNKTKAKITIAIIYATKYSYSFTLEKPKRHYRSVHPSRLAAIDAAHQQSASPSPWPPRDDVAEPIADLVEARTDVRRSVQYPKPTHMGSQSG